MNDFDLIDELNKLVHYLESRDETYDEFDEYDRYFQEGCEHAADYVKELIAKLGG